MRKFIVTIFVILCCAATAFLYFGNPFATTEKAPIKVYKADPAIRKQPKSGTSLDTATSKNAPENRNGTASEVSQPIEVSSDASSLLDTNVLLDVARETGNLTAEPTHRHPSIDAEPHTHPDEDHEASDQWAEEMRLEYEEIREEGNALAIEASRLIVYQLQQMSEEKQVELLEKMKASVLSATDPGTGIPMFDTQEDAYEMWDAVFNSLIQQGYTPPQEY